MSDIEWTDETWNPTTGCDRISAGCDNCYALTMAARLKGFGQAKYQTDGDPRTSGPGFGLALHDDVVGQPLRWQKPRVIFVNSMSDLFHKDVPVPFIRQVWDVMAATQDRHVFQVLTKRPKRMRTVLADLHDCDHGGAPVMACDWCAPLPNVWLGTSVEDEKAERRIDQLRLTPAAVRFVSAEPLIGPPSNELNLGGIDWVIIGGESGGNARPLNLQWVRDWMMAAREVGAAVFVKQMGSLYARGNGGPGKGGDPAYWPADLRVREMPEGAGSMPALSA